MNNCYAVVRQQPGNMRFTEIYEELHLAKNEAERLCILNSDTFYIIHFIGKYQPQKPPAEWVSA